MSQVTVDHEIESEVRMRKMATAYRDFVVRNVAYTPVLCFVA